MQLVPQTAQTVSPTLGKDQLRAGIVAGLIGLALVALYMILFYRLLGLVVWIGIGLTALTFFTLVSWLSSASRPDAHAGGGDRHHRVGGCHRRQLCRVLRTIKG